MKYLFVGLIFIFSGFIVECQNKPLDLGTFDTIRLLKPEMENGKLLMKTMQRRKSDRTFATENISLKQLSEILWVANGVNRDNGKRTVPSAMALYPLETYVFLANGAYLYSPERHILIPIVKGDFRELTTKQGFAEEAPVNVVFIANYNKYDAPRKVPQEKRLYLASLDAGHSCQNIYLYCAQEGLKTVERAGAKEKELLECLKLDNNYQFIVAQTIGN